MFICARLSTWKTPIVSARAEVVVHRLVGHVELREVDGDAARLPDVRAGSPAAT